MHYMKKWLTTTRQSMINHRYNNNMILIYRVRIIKQNKRVYNI